ncbi:hypothetical protein MRX96_037021 [Rhipicephalus microplus]
MLQEIKIHRSLKHKHILSFHSYFEDDKNVYIILELCSRRSLMEMHRRRRALTEGEARYFLHQLLLACRYLVQQKVIHRDLKLGNLLLNDNMELKVGGLRACHTFAGHSFEVDIWSIGCILFTLLVGRPPFEASSVEETYNRIKKNEYHVPPSVSSAARKLIRKMLQSDPKRRPDVEAIFQDEFMTTGPMPSRLPTSCLTTEPRHDTLNATLTVNGRKPLLERNEGPGISCYLDYINVHDYHQIEELRSVQATMLSLAQVMGVHQLLKLAASAACTAPKKVTPFGNSTGKEAKPAQRLEHQQPASPSGSQKPATEGPASEISPQKAHLSELQRLLTFLVKACPPELRFERPDEAEDPASMPVFWISKWVDYTAKYGLGYQLCDNSIGVLYNDNSRIILLGNGQSITYVDEQCIEHYHTLENYPSSLEKKITLLKYFYAYMKQYLLTTGADVSPRECDNLVRLPCVRAWRRTQVAIAFHLTNGTVQINFFHGHTKLILCPLMAAVTYVDDSRAFHTYRLETLRKGCPPELLSRLKYACTILDQLSSTS